MTQKASIKGLSTQSASPATSMDTTKTITSWLSRCETTWDAGDGRRGNCPRCFNQVSLFYGWEQPKEHCLPLASGLVSSCTITNHVSTAPLLIWYWSPSYLVSVDSSCFVLSRPVGLMPKTVIKIHSRNRSQLAWLVESKRERRQLKKKERNVCASGPYCLVHSVSCNNTRASLFLLFLFFIVRWLVCLPLQSLHSFVLWW